MKKTTILAAALLLFTAACGKQTSAPQAAESTAPAETAASAETAKPESSGEDQRRLEELFSANQGDIVLKRHSSRTVSRTISSGDNTLASIYTYVDQDKYFRETSTGQALYLTAEEYGMTAPEAGVTGAILVNPESIYQEWLDQAKSTNSYSLMESETVKSAEEHDGQLYFTTVTPSLTVGKELFESFIKEFGIELQYQESLELTTINVFDSESSDIVSIDTFFTDADGNKVLDIMDEYTYDKDFAPDYENSALAEWLKEDRPRKIEVTFYPGTDQEETKAYMVPKNTVLSVFYNGSYAEQVYADAACTEPMGKTDRVSDLSIYVK